MTDRQPDEQDSKPIESPELNDSAALPHTSTSYKILGEETLPGGSAIVGHNTTTTGISNGIIGVTDSPNVGAAGVVARADDAMGLYAKTNGSSAEAIYAEAPNSTAIRAESDDSFGAGVTALNSNGTAIEGFSSNRRGVYGRTNRGGQSGIYGTNQANTNPDTAGAGIEGQTFTTGTGSAGVKGTAGESSGQTYGISGQTRSQTDGAAGVYGETFDATGQTYGVRGFTDSFDQQAAGILGEANATGDAAAVRASGRLDVDGDVKMVGGLPSGSGDDVGIDSNNRLVNLTSSSVRYKTNVEPLASDTDTTPVLDLEPRQFEFAATGDAGIGYLAEEVDEKLPELVTYDDQGRPDGVTYHRLAVVLQPEVRENRERVADLESDGDHREERIQDLESDGDEREERIQELEAENERLRDRLAALEAHLDVDESGRQSTPADD